jgi:hypothetical protein
MVQFSRETRKSVTQLLTIVALIAISYACIRTLSFKVEVFNFPFVCLFLLIPFLAIGPILRFQRGTRILGMVLLSPLLMISSCFLIATASCNEPWSLARTQPLQSFQLGSSTVELQRYDNGGAIGLHGLNLEQRRLIVPGLFLVRNVDFIESAYDGVLSEEGPYIVRLRAKGSYYDNHSGIDRVYSLKPWVYF